MPSDVKYKPGTMDADTFLCDLRSSKDKRRLLTEQIFESIKKNKPINISDVAVNAVYHDSIKTIINIFSKCKIITDKTYFSLTEQNKFNTLIMELARYYKYWIRNPKDWSPSSHNQQKKISSFIRFLFCKYSVPIFMDSCWMLDSVESDDNHKKWFIAIGNGKNIRTMDALPIKLTKRMAHLFSQAPDNLTVNEALRWCHAKSLGASDHVIRGILTTPLGKNFVNNDFWESVIIFWINCGMLPINQYRAIYDYIYNQKFQNRNNVYIEGEDRFVNLGPLQPNFSMHKREPATLIKHVEEWHKQLNRNKKNNSLPERWPSCGINGFEKIEKHIRNGAEYETRYTIDEITYLKELAIEGSAMRHCVYSYARNCIDRRCAIYSMKKFEFGKMERIGTIELISQQKQIGQFSGKFNAKVDVKGQNILYEWARKEGLLVSKYIVR